MKSSALGSRSRVLNGDGSIELNKRLSSGTRISLTLAEEGSASPANCCAVIAGRVYECQAGDRKAATKKSIRRRSFSGRCLRVG